VEEERDELELLQLCIEGDRRAWSEFVRRFSRYVYYLIQVTAKRHGVRIDEEESSDLHNDLFLALLEDDRRRLKAFKGTNGCSVRSWVRVITIRRTIDALRKRRRFVSLDADPTDRGGPPVIEDGMPDALEQLMLREKADRRARLGELAAQLSATDRLLLEMLFVQKLSPDLIATTLRIKKGALYTRKTRLLKRLHAHAQSAGLLEEPS
jgi:RNA polymerase sigma factor (sigma-70 family)